MSTAGRKLFVGSLPYGIQDSTLRAEFSRFGQVEDVFVKPNCDPTRQWAFVTMATPEQANNAKDQCDRVLMFPGVERACDVMVAKNQGMFGQQYEGQDSYYEGASPYGYDQGYSTESFRPAAGVAPRKIFVGSLPDGIPPDVLRGEFSKYGTVEDVFMKENCEPGRQWAFVTFTTPEQANNAQQSANGILQFPGSFRPCEVTMARNQGQFGQDPIAPGPPRSQGGYPGGYYQANPVTENQMAPKKVFVGSLPTTITDTQLRQEFSKYGQVIDVHINYKQCDSGRQWAFVTFATPEQANTAKVSTDRVLIFPGSDKACEVTLARHQGLFGQEPIGGESGYPTGPGGKGGFGWGPAGGQSMMGAGPMGPKKIFVGSMPEMTTEPTLRAEFSKFGHVIDVHINTKPVEPGRQWAFVTFASHDQAQNAKDMSDRVLRLPGSEWPCEVMLAKNQGKFGQDPIGGGGGPPQSGGWAPGHFMPETPSQPPPPNTPPPAHLTKWQLYKTASGIPYYYNNSTGVTQWECPPELQGMPKQKNPFGVSATPMPQGHGRRYTPY